jgi:hypothetical protein
MKGRPPKVTEPLCLLSFLHFPRSSFANCEFAFANNVRTDSSHGLSHILRKREDAISVGFRAADLQAPTPPIDVCKCDVGDLLGTEPETQEDQQKRPVTKVAGPPTFTG